MLGPILCGSFSRAPLLPKLRGHFAEFLNNASPAGLRILSSSTCVGLRYGCDIRNSGFSRQPVSMLHYFCSLRITLSDCMADLPAILLWCLHRIFLFRPMPSRCVPTVLIYHSTGISTCCPSATSSDLALGHRLTQGRSALPWKPWIFDREDSHFSLATHSGILSSRQSTTPSGMASFRLQCSSTNHF